MSDHESAGCLCKWYSKGSCINKYAESLPRPWWFRLMLWIGLAKELPCTIGEWEHPENCEQFQYPTFAWKR